MLNGERVARLADNCDIQQLSFKLNLRPFWRSRDMFHVDEPRLEDGTKKACLPPSPQVVASVVGNQRTVPTSVRSLEEGTPVRVPWLPKRLQACAGRLIRSGPGPGSCRSVARLYTKTLEAGHGIVRGRGRRREYLFSLFHWEDIRALTDDSCARRQHARLCFEGAR